MAGARNRVEPVWRGVLIEQWRERLVCFWTLSPCPGIPAQVPQVLDMKADFVSQAATLLAENEKLVVPLFPMLPR